MSIIDQAPPLIAGSGSRLICLVHQNLGASGENGLSRAPRLILHKGRLWFQLGPITCWDIGYSLPSDTRLKCIRRSRLRR